MQVSSSLANFLTTDLESWSPSRFRLGGDAEKLCSDTPAGGYAPLHDSYPAIRSATRYYPATRKPPSDQPHVRSPMPSARTAKRKIFERGRTPGHVQQWSDGRFKCQVVGSPALPHTRIVGRTRRSEILHQPPTSLLVPAAPICFLLQKTQRLRYCYSQKNPVLRTLSAWFVNMWKMIQKIKHKKTCNWFCTSARPTVFFS